MLSKHPRGGQRGQIRYPARIFLVDDHPVVRQGLRDLLESHDDLRIVGEAESAPEALSALRDDVADGAIIDLSLGRGGGLELIRGLRSLGVKLPILVLSMHEEWLYAERSLRAGADGYVSKSEPGEQVVDALRKVLAGEMHLSESMRTRSLRNVLRGGSGDQQGVERLTERELQVFEALADGAPTRRIAEHLGVSVKTVETHRANIKTKLGLESASELSVFAAHWKAERL